MPVTYSIDLVDRCVSVRATGPVTAAEMWRVRGLIATDHSYDPRMRLLIDWTEGDLGAISGDDIRQLAEASISRRSVRRAFVVGDALGFGLARMFHGYEGLEAGPIKVFRDRAVAESWLEGITPDPEK